MHLDSKYLRAISVRPPNRIQLDWLGLRIGCESASFRGVGNYCVIFRMPFLTAVGYVVLADHCAGPVARCERAGTWQRCCKWRSSLRVRCVSMALTLPVFGYGAAFSITYHPPGMEALARSIHCPTVCTYLSNCVGPLSCQFLTVTAGTNCRHPPEPGVACNDIAIAGFPNVGSFGFAGETIKLPRVRSLGQWEDRMRIKNTGERCRVLPMRC